MVRKNHHVVHAVAAQVEQEMASPVSQPRTVDGFLDFSSPPCWAQIVAGLSTNTHPSLGVGEPNKNDTIDGFPCLVHQ